MFNITPSMAVAMLPIHAPQPLPAPRPALPDPPAAPPGTFHPWQGFVPPYLSGGNLPPGCIG